ncbi:hypothetical protein ACFO1B_36605 [Dactylosporangium siamense]|uniref:Uncharacterized protein n=1 Tax=Dactylosporangium siamense TaxID=685454 RepID=A0A919UF49_9ACTN|nr:hypothetical protein [Dactylosporangium siamense]GIG49285.1 hypothetical protein Dsi01nite_073260 [Dactylosporangium siamense]
MAESYRRWRLPELWEMVAADDAADAHLHLATLRRQQTALETQRDRLRVLRDQLAEAWPPEKSEAAKMFIQRLNDMIEALTVTALGAAEVRGGADLVTDAINRAREQLAPLVERYAKAQSLPDPRIGRQAQKMLDQEARRVLMAADVTVRDATSKFTVALPGYARISLQTDVPPATGGNNPTGGTAGNSGTKSGAARQIEFSPPRFDSPAPVFDDVVGDEVVLAEGQLGTNSIGSRIGDLGAVQAGGVSPLGYQESIGGIGRVLGVRPSSATNVTGTDEVVRGVGAGAMRGTPGSVIGGPPMASSGSAARGRLTQTPLATPRPAPSTGRPIAGASGYQDRSFEEYVSRRRERRNEHGEQWTVNQGVRPLLEALQPARAHDPGPGVIGLDR